MPTESDTTPTTGDTPTPASVDLPAEIDALLDGREGLYEVVVIGPGGVPDYRRNAEEQLESASLYKLLIMVEIYRQVEEGIIELDDPVKLYAGFFDEAGYDDPFDPSYVGQTVTVEELLHPMIAFSSNVAAFALLDLAGNLNINGTAAALGLTASEIRWMPALQSGSVGDLLASYAGTTRPAVPADEAFNVTNAVDMALLFQLLIEGKVVSPEASASMLDLLADQVVNNRLPALLPPDAVVAHKTGNIDNVVHDAGVVYTPSGPAVIVVLTADALEWQAIEFMSELALLVYEHG